LITSLLKIQKLSHSQGRRLNPMERWMRRQAQAYQTRRRQGCQKRRQAVLPGTQQQEKLLAPRLLVVLQ
jgi:hypothetical protein